MKNTYIILAIAGIVVTAILLYGFTKFGGNSGDANTTEVSTTTPTSDQVVITDNEKSAEESIVSEKNIVELASEAGNFSTLIAAIEAAGLVETLSSGEYTVLAPTDEAFAKLPEGTLNALLEDKERLTRILKYHLISGKVLSSEVAKLSTSQTVLGQNVNIKNDDGVITINDSSVIGADLQAKNGLIHVIDTVLIPE